MIKRLILILFLIPNLTNAAVIINEIMYDFPGIEGNGEHDWIEVTNNGTVSVDLSTFKFFEANTNHGLKFDRGSTMLLPGAFAIIANATSTFLVDFPNFNGTLFDSSFSLNSTSAGEMLVIRTGEFVDEDSVTYSSDWGAKNDGRSLQKINEVWVAANPTPGGVNLELEQTSQQQTSSSTPSISEPTPEAGSVSWPAEQQIYANAGKDKTVIVGADVYFSGQALGIEKEPLENARYLWNFGDGAMAENQNVKHVYQYPGEYIAVLDVSSGKYSVSDNLLVKVIPNQLKIIEANEEFVKLQNGSNNNLDISGWVLRAGNETFKFPASTFIKANLVLMIPFSISGIKISINEKIELLYSNWSVANSFINAKQLALDTPEVKSSVTEQIEENGQIEESGQVAGVVTTIEKEDFWGTKKWWGLAGLIGVLSAAGFLFIRRKTPVL